MARVFLGLGSNVGDGAATIRAAFAELSRILDEARLSRLWRSRAMYLEDQDDFVNAAACGETSITPHELLAAVNGIEALFGRDRRSERPKGPRTLDIDMLLYGSFVIHESDLILPHAGLKERRFALQPLMDLDSGLRDPESGEAYSAILATLPPQGIYLME
jgi:2-amino-4-hydroxy-6-hydroxymethyldihydropteridine diphosphokinase